MINLRKITKNEEDTNLAITLINKYKDYLYSSEEVTSEKHIKFLESLEKKSDYLWIIEKETETEKELCGMVSVYHIDEKNKKCEWGRFIVDEKFKGVGSIVETMVLDFVFNELTLNKLYCEVMIMNDLTIKLHKKFGFVTEGILLDHVYKNEKFMDVIYMALRKDEWNKVYRDRFIKLFSNKIGTIEK